MAFFSQTLFMIVVVTLFFETVLLILMLTRKKRLLSEEARTMFEKNTKTAYYVGVFLILSLLLYFISEIVELFEVKYQTYPVTEALHTIHMAFLLVVLVLMSRLTYSMGWGK